MSTQENSQALSDFFSRYDSNAFTYNPRNDSNEEFDRLCDARQWDQIKREKKLEKYLTALHGHSSSPSGMFFRKYWVPDFVYNPSGNQRNAFNRLQERMKWDGTELEEALKEFQAAAGRNAAPIAVFLMGQKIPGYSYGSERAELEFRKLVGAHRHIWEQEIEMGHDVEDGEGRRKWRESTEFKSLQEGFYDAVEQHFGVTLDKIGLEAGLRRDEVLAELYRVGKAPLTKKEAETALESVHLNVFDFIAASDAIIYDPDNYKEKGLIDSLSPIVRRLNFRSEQGLSLYSMTSGRGFPSCGKHSEPISLLRRICQNLEGLPGAAADDFAEALDEGPDALRELVWSRDQEASEGMRRIAIGLTLNSTAPDV